MPILNYLIFAILIIAIGLAFFFISKRARKKRLSDALNLKLLLIRLPQKQPKDFSIQGGPASDWKDEINLSAQLFSILYGLKQPFGLEDRKSTRLNSTHS